MYTNCTQYGKTANTDVILTSTDGIFVNTDGILSNTDVILTLPRTIGRDRSALRSLLYVAYPVGGIRQARFPTEVYGERMPFSARKRAPFLIERTDQSPRGENYLIAT